MNPRILTYMIPEEDAVGDEYCADLACCGPGSNVNAVFFCDFGGEVLDLCAAGWSFGDMDGFDFTVGQRIRYQVMDVLIPESWILVSDSCAPQECLPCP